jgi:O-acetyl-ADP-ribose deacetylase (regulator of RNase III)
MGRGIALQFRKEFPENYAAYKKACDRRELVPGRVFVFKLDLLQYPRYVINFPTKRHWKGKSRIEDIQAGLNALVEEVRARGIKSVAVPPLGCGLGGLDWSQVRPMIETAFLALPEVDVLVFEPAGAPAAEAMAKSKKAPNMTPGRAALLGLMRRYLAAAMDPDISLLEIHKLMYFMQEAGEDLRLGFVKGHYGPYAEKLRHVLTRVEGHFLTGYGDAEDDPERRIELNLKASKRADSFLEDHPETGRRLSEVADLIRGFETSYGMELLATVHWVARREGASDADAAAEKVYSWNDRKRMFREEHIPIAWQVLAEKGWLTES